MTQQLLYATADLLRGIGTTALQATQAPTSPGSIMAAKMERDGGIGNDECPFPFGLAHTVHRMLVYAAGERLATIVQCLQADPIPHAMSAAELARAAAEAASTACWLGEKKADGDRRLRRLLGLLKTASDAETGLRRALGLAPSADGSRQVLRWGHSKEIRHERPGTHSQLLQRASKATGAADYQVLSAIAHSEIHAVLAIWSVVVQAQGGNLDPLRVQSANTALAAARYVLFGVESVRRTNGGQQHDLEGLTVHLDELAARAGVLAATI